MAPWRHTMSVITRLHARDLFQGLNPEQEQYPDRQIDINSNPCLKEIIWGFECINKWWAPDINAGFRTASEVREQSEVRATDIEQFSLIASRYQEVRLFEEKLGFYLSGLVAMCKDESIVVHTNHLLNPPEGLTQIVNGKHLTVQGDVGKSFGRDMREGTIHVKGDALEAGSKMKGGTIIVDGDNIYGKYGSLGIGYQMVGGAIYIRGDTVGDIGSEMDGGSIEIEGDAKRCSVGKLMKSGLININGDRMRLSKTIRGGHVYHKGIKICGEEGT